MGGLLARMGLGWVDHPKIVQIHDRRLWLMLKALQLIFISIAIVQIFYFNSWAQFEKPELQMEVWYGRDLQPNVLDPIDPTECDRLKAQEQTAMSCMLPSVLNPATGHWKSRVNNTNPDCAAVVAMTPDGFTVPWDRRVCARFSPMGHVILNKETGSHFVDLNNKEQPFECAGDTKNTNCSVRYLPEQSGSTIFVDVEQFTLYWQVAGKASFSDDALIPKTIFKDHTGKTIFEQPADGKPFEFTLGSILRAANVSLDEINYQPEFGSIQLPYHSTGIWLMVQMDMYNLKPWSVSSEPVIELSVRVVQGKWAYDLNDVRWAADGKSGMQVIKLGMMVVHNMQGLVGCFQWSALISSVVNSVVILGLAATVMFQYVSNLHNRVSSDFAHTKLYEQYDYQLESDAQPKEPVDDQRVDTVQNPVAVQMNSNYREPKASNDKPKASRQLHGRGTNVSNPGEPGAAGTSGDVLRERNNKDFFNKIQEPSSASRVQDLFVKVNDTPTMQDQSRARAEKQKAAKQRRTSARSRSPRSRSPRSPRVKVALDV